MVPLPTIRPQRPRWSSVGRAGPGRASEPAADGQRWEAAADEARSFLPARPAARRLTRPGGALSLRVRLALAIAAVVAVVTTAVSLVVYDLDRNERIDQARTAAARHVIAVASVYNQTGSFAQEAERERPGEESPNPSIPPALRALLRRSGDVATVIVRVPLPGAHPFVVAGVEAADGSRFYVFEDYGPVLAGLRSLRVTLLRVGLAGTLAGALLGWIAATLLARPLRRAAELARDLAAGDLNARLEVRGSDEVADLSRALNEMAESLSTKIRELDAAALHEQRFSADVAHELRTPITGIVAAASLLEDSPAADRVRERAASMAALVQDLLEVMRLEAGSELPRTDAFDLVRLVRDVVAQRAPDAEVVAPESVRVRSDPRRVERIIANLLDNAVRHGRPPISVRVEPHGRLTVRDSGPGYGDFLTRAGDRFAMADGSRGGGTGLGLAIARGQAAVLGADLKLYDDGGAVATMALPVVTQS